MKKLKICSLFICFILICITCGAFGCEKNENITFYISDNESVVVKAENGGVITLPDDPKSENMGFKGWFTQKNGKGERITCDTIARGNMTAYAYFTNYIDMTDRNIIEIGGYNGVTEELHNNQQVTYAKESDFEILSELNVDLIYLTYYPNPSAVGVYESYLDYLDKYKIKAFVRDVELNEKLAILSKNLDFNNTVAVNSAVGEIKPLIDRYASRPLFKANFLIDEPLPTQLESLSLQAKLYQLAMPNSYMYVNLLPNYAGIFEKSDEKYQDYVKKFSDCFSVPYIEQDHYPIHTKPALDGNNVKFLEAANYYKGMYYPACVARDTGRDYGNYIWTMKNCASNENRNYAPSVSDLRFEAFNSLAFGASKINLFCASTPPAFVGVAQGVIDNGAKTEGLWTNTVQVLAELRALSNVYNQYIWQDASSFFAGSGYGSSMILALPTAYNSHLHNLASNTDLLIGLFEQANSDGAAFMLVNNCEITSNSSSNISFSIAGAKKVTMHKALEKTVLEKGIDGKYSLVLESGQGVFVTLDK